jgi:hypothetical protein
VKKYKLKTVTLFLLCASFTVVQAQNSAVSSGGTATGEGGTASYSVGQVFHQTIEGDGGTLSEGVQQPYIIIIETGIETANKIELKAVAYPNPTTDKLILEIADFKIADLSYKITDINGKVIQKSNISSNKTEVSMNTYESGTYLFHINKNNTNVKTFKVIKK